jgi:hypothetical protein
MDGKAIKYNENEMIQLKSISFFKAGKAQTS